MEKLKSRWRKNYLEGDESINNEIDCDTGEINNAPLSNTLTPTSAINNESNKSTHHNHSNNNSNHHHSSKHHSSPPTYEHINENLYLDKRKNDHRSKKDARAMVCDCILTKEERLRGVMGCMDDCLNRMLMIECGPKCSLGDHCLNKRFQKCQSAKVEIFKTKKKGWGLRTLTDLQAGTFIMEYVGEVVRSKEFRSRVKKYTKQKIKHHYFMALRSDEIIDATCKGNLTRFINHSCEPNCETQKWTVNGDLRIGFFTIRDLKAGEEVTFDYQFQRYGRKAQKCYCESKSCREFIGGSDKTFSLNGHSSPQHHKSKSHKKAYKHGLLVDVTLEDKINALAEEAAEGLKTRDQVIALATLSLKTEELNDRRKLLNIIRLTKSEFSLRLFVDYHGLEIICLWMRDPSADCDFKATIIEILEKLPIQNKTKVMDSHVFRWIEKWATEEPKSTEIAISEANSAENSNGIDEKTRSTFGSDGNKDGDEGESKSAFKTSNHDDSTTDSQITNPPLTPIKRTSPQDLLTQQITETKSPNIRALANRLLKKFQALNPGFKIPRLNRLQRMEIEKRMQEEFATSAEANREKEKPINADTTNPFLRHLKTSTIPSTNGVGNNATLKPNSAPAKRKFDSFSSTNNIDLTPAPKISKEEHRQQFELQQKMKDYCDALEKVHGSTYVEHMRQRASLSNSQYLNGLPLPYPQHILMKHQQTPLIFVQQSPALMPPLPIAQPIVGTSYCYDPNPQLCYYPPQATTPATSGHTQVVHGKPATKLSNDNKLIVLVDNFFEPLDNDLAFSICDYDEYYTNREKPLEASDVVNNESTNPYPGSYYTTPDGEKWFFTVTIDKKTQQARNVLLNLTNTNTKHRRDKLRDGVPRKTG